MDVRENVSNVKRLIDANKLIDFIDVGHLRHPGELCYSEVDIANILLHAPTVDAVPVVRCRECKYWGDEEGKLQCSDGALMARCKVHNYLIDGRHTGWCPTENDFCSYGERKEGADNELYKKNETRE